VYTRCPQKVMWFSSSTAQTVVLNADHEYILRCFNSTSNTLRLLNLLARQAPTSFSRSLSPLVDLPSPQRDKGPYLNLELIGIEPNHMVQYVDRNDPSTRM
jgi:hypothetical protein